MANVCCTEPNCLEEDVDGRAILSSCDSTMDNPPLEHRVVGRHLKLGAGVILTAHDPASVPHDELDFQGRQLLFVERGGLRVRVTSIDEGGAAVLLRASGEVSSLNTGVDVDLVESDAVVLGFVHAKVSNPGNITTFLQATKVSVVGPPGCPGNCF